MSFAYEVSIEDVQQVLAEGGMSLSLEKAGTFRNQLDFRKIEQAALYGDEINIQTKYARSEIRKQFAALGLCDLIVSEWVALNYRRNFDMESHPKKRDWRDRWAAAMERDDIDG